MDCKLRKKVNDLRKRIFDEYKELMEQKQEDEFELIEFSLAILLSFNTLFPIVSDILHEEDEMGYYDFEKMYKKKDDTYKLAFNLKKEFIEKLGYSEEFINSHENIKITPFDNGDIDYIGLLSSKLKTLQSNCGILKENLLRYKNIKFENIKPLVTSVNEMYNEYSEIYSNYLELDYEDEDSDDYNSEYEYDKNIEDESEEEFEDKWKDICDFNYDIGFINDIYYITFGEINEEQRLIIGIMISDFYEYHKCNEKMYTRPDNNDILNTINYIETHTPKELIQYFLEQPTWSCFIIDTYMYYNANFTTEQKLDNRITIKNMGKLNILKNNNKFIDDTLKDETLYNSFITPIGQLIRSINYSVFYTIDSINSSQTDELLLKYFTSDFIPENLEDDIPEEIKNMDIKTLKSLQLKFIISDFFARKLSENNHNIEMLLKFGKPDGIYNAIISDRKTLKYILEDFSKNLDNNDEIELNEKQRQKIIKFNAFTAFDNL